jgi:hypothetical protein
MGKTDVNQKTIKSYLEKAFNDLRTPYFILLFMYALAVLTPLGIPSGISQNTRDFFEILDATPAGGVILMETNQAFSFGSGAECLLTMYRHLLQRDWKIVWFSAFPSPGQGVQGWIDTIDYLDTVMGEGPEAHGKVYGVDYVYLGWIPGGEGAISALTEDIWKTVPADYDGTELSDLPLMANIKSWEDFDLCIAGPIWGVHVPWWVRQWWGVGRSEVVPMIIWVPHIGWHPGYDYAYAFPAAFHGPQSAWEYEGIYGIPSLTGYLRDGIGLGSMTMLGYMLLNNAVFLYKKYRGGE